MSQVIELPLGRGAVMLFPKFSIPCLIVRDALGDIKAVLVFCPGEFYAALFATHVVLIGLYAGEVAP